MSVAKREAMLRISKMREALFLSSNMREELQGYNIIKCNVCTTPKNTKFVKCDECFKQQYGNDLRDRSWMVQGPSLAYCQAP